MHELAEPRRWPESRWWILIGLVFATQLVLIFWLGKPRPVIPPADDLVPSVHLAGRASGEVLALKDPTLFALPHSESFSGLAWLTIPSQDFAPFAWSEPPRWLSLAQDRLGADFEVFMATNQLNGVPVFAQPELELRLPVVAQSAPFQTQSKLRLMGALAGRRLLVSPSLPSWPSAEILTNSVVQVLVTADGKPVSPPTLLSKSGSAEADQHAEREARRARFEPLNTADPAKPLTGMTWGQLVFEWHTLPMTATNNALEPAPAK